MELVDGDGWTEALPALHSRAFAVALVVCRPHLVGPLLTALGDPPPKLLEVTVDSRGALSCAIEGELREVIGRPA